MDAKLRFIYMPVLDLKSALKLYRDQLDLEEAWREGEHTVAFKLPDTLVQVMVSQPGSGEPQLPGPMFELPDLDVFYAERKSHLEFVGEPMEIPSGKMVGVRAGGENAIYFFDQKREERV